MRSFSYIISLALSICLPASAQSYPGLILTKSGVEIIKTNPHPKLFAKALKSAQRTVHKAMVNPISVPFPKDMAGGYSHQKHKDNYKEMHLAGTLYQITDNAQYAEFVSSMLLEYADVFPTWSMHPSKKSYARGKLFWQCLNDANWLVYVAQAYDAVHDYLSKVEREKIEQHLLRPYADFISVENPKFFNRVHNHSTWGNAAVGMIGLVLNDDELVHRALYGLQIEKGTDLLKDSDRGFIYESGKPKAGFFAQIDYAFSPDGYYTEGPYYQRYAMLPFMVFAQALDNKRPELKIFEYRNGLLAKAVKALLSQTYGNGEFFPINDAQKGMSLKSGSVITAVNIAYGATQDPAFIGAAKMQGRVLLDQNGFAIAQKLNAKSKSKFKKESIELRDGKDGSEGALGILRTGVGKDEVAVAYKYTGQGLGHGHFDKLSYSYYVGDTEVVQDYGAARWVNVDQKDGGRYLQENKTWAKQTLAHNTIIVDGTSHFGGDYDVAVDKYSIPVYFDASNPDLQLASAKETSAYEGIEIHRTIALWQDDYFQNPLLVDVVSITASESHTYELPTHHAGQVMDHSFEYEINTPKVMGDKHGYEHVYQEASGQIEKKSWQFSWMKDRKFFTRISTSEPGDAVLLARIGANDPNFNLRRDPFIIHKKDGKEDATFISVIENHGKYNPVAEKLDQSYAKIRTVEIIEESDKKIQFKIIAKNKEWMFIADKASGQISIHNN